MPIRRLTEVDVPAYLALRREMLADAPWAFASSPEDDHALAPDNLARAVASADQAIVGAFGDAGALVGAAGLYRDPHRKMAHRARIWGVYITPSARGRGLGASLMTATLDVARPWPGVTSAGLSVSERAVAAIRLYQRLGFRQWGLEPGALVWEGRAYDEIHMVVDLGKAP
jgi:RimJ/RimL family protein N-acetyltransferase